MSCYVTIVEQLLFGRKLALCFEMGICQCAPWLNLTAITLRHLYVRFSQCVSSCRSSILSEVSTRSSSKLPSGKNILVFGKHYLSHTWKSACAVFSLYLWRACKLQNYTEPIKANDCTLKPFWLFKQPALPTVFLPTLLKVRHNKQHTERSFHLGHTTLAFEKCEKYCYWTEICVR